MQRFGKCAWLLLAGFPALLSAQGFGIFEQNTCAMGRAGTAAAAPCPDGSAIFFNPAGLAGLPGGHVSLGVTLIRVKGGYTDDIFQETTDLNDPLLPVPQAYVSYAVTPKLGVGVGLFAPYGLQTRWPLTFDGRFSGYDNILKTFYVQPTIAYQVTPGLKLGAGLDIVHGSVELHQQVDLSQTLVPVAGLPPGTTFGAFGIPYGTAFADANLQASKTAMGGHFGAIVDVNDRLSIGAHYLMKVKLDYAGTARFTQVNTGIIIPADITIPGLPPIPAGTQLDAFLRSLGVFSTGGVLADQTVTTSISNPDMLVLGVAYKLKENLTVLADYQWTHWSTFEVLDLTFAPTTALNRTLYESYKSTSGIRLGAEYVVEVVEDLPWTFRGGYLYHQGAAPPQTVTALLPEGARNEVTVGLGVKFAERLTGDFAYQYIRQNDRRGRTRDAADGSPPTIALNNGLYTFSAHLFGVSLAFTF
jgi:long-chain fatty acid transport protein